MSAKIRTIALVGAAVGTAKCHLDNRTGAAHASVLVTMNEGRFIFILPRYAVNATQSIKSHDCCDGAESERYK
jgi:hypothetical protein